MRHNHWYFLYTTTPSFESSTTSQHLFFFSLLDKGVQTPDEWWAQGWGCTRWIWSGLSAWHKHADVAPWEKATLWLHRSQFFFFFVFDKCAQTPDEWCAGRWGCTRSVGSGLSTWHRCANVAAREKATLWLHRSQLFFLFLLFLDSRTQTPNEWCVRGWGCMRWIRSGLSAWHRCADVVSWQTGEKALWFYGSHGRWQLEKRGQHV
jgi:hypothetical protein